MAMSTEEPPTFPSAMEDSVREVFCPTAVVQDSNYLADIEGPSSDKREQRTGKIKGFILCDLCGEYHHHMRRSSALARGVSCRSLAPSAIAPGRPKERIKKTALKRCLTEGDERKVEIDVAEDSPAAERPSKGRFSAGGRLHKRVYKYKKCKSCGAYHHWKSKCLSQLFAQCASIGGRNVKEEDSVDQMATEDGPAKTSHATNLHRRPHASSRAEVIDCFACGRRHSWRVPCLTLDDKGASSTEQERNSVRKVGVFKRKFKGYGGPSVGKRVRRTYNYRVCELCGCAHHWKVKCPGGAGARAESDGGVSAVLGLARGGGRGRFKERGRRARGRAFGPIRKGDVSRMARMAAGVKVEEEEEREAWRPQWAVGKATVPPHVEEAVAAVYRAAEAAIARVREEAERQVQLLVHSVGGGTGGAAGQGGSGAEAEAGAGAEDGSMLDG